MADIGNARIAMLAMDGFEGAILTETRERLETQGAQVRVVSPRHGAIRADDTRASVPVDTPLVHARVEDFDALVLPDGGEAPIEASVVAFIRDFHGSGRPVAAIGRAPLLLAEAELVGGRTVTSADAARPALEAAGAEWSAAAALHDGGIVTGREIGVFCARIGTALRAMGRTRRVA